MAITGFTDQSGQVAVDSKLSGSVHLQITRDIGKRTNVRAGYLRTIKRPPNAQPWDHDRIRYEVYQVVLTRPYEISSSPPRYRWMIGACTDEDARLLNLLLEVSSPPGEDEVLAWQDEFISFSKMTESRVQNSLDWDSFGQTFRYKWISRDDITVYVGCARARTGPGKDLLRRLKREGVEVKVIRLDSHYSLEDLPPAIEIMIQSGTGRTEIEDLLCDETMLRDSAWVADGIAQNYVMKVPHFAASSLRDWDSATRHGVSERGLDEKFDVSRERRRMKQGGYTWRSCCFAGKCSWRNHDYKCFSCGGKCKRKNGCSVTGAFAPPGKAIGYGYERRPGMDLPKSGDKRWIELTAQEMAFQFRRRKMQGQELWSSVAQFSGE